MAASMISHPATISFEFCRTRMPFIPSCAWTRSLGLGWQQPYTVRYASNLDDGPWHGAPLGGFGAGCLGRSPQGDFNLWHLDGGEHTFQTMPACQFSVFEQFSTASAKEQRQAYALCTMAPDDGSLSQWQWYPASQDSNSDQQTGEYHALYPRSWFVYRNVFRADLTCEQFSPIWPHNYQESSYPVAVFQWTAHNPTDQPLTLSVMITWQNMVGWFTNRLKRPEIRLRDDGSPIYDYEPRLGDSAGNFNQWATEPGVAGCVMARTWEQADRQDPMQLSEGEGQWAIVAEIPDRGVEVFYHTRWNPVADGADLWQSFSQDGSLPNYADETPATTEEQIGAALALRFTLAPGETRQIPIVLAWDLPVTEFAQGITAYRRYTDFFGREGIHAWAIAKTALKHQRTWQIQIQQWQQEILDQQWPDWFSMALFNELYVLTGGGTLWSAADAENPIGQFGVLECIDYRWYESLDVRLYGAFALVILFPELEVAVLQAFTRAIADEDPKERIIGYNRTMAPRKIANATPHDLGAPNEHPWQKTNYTCYQDCNLWKDLPCDFVLQVYRAYHLTAVADRNFLAGCWGAIVAALAYLKTFDQDGDGIPENSGAPDQTFDDWRLVGISAYCGGLWLAALEAAIAIGTILLQSSDAYPQWLQDKHLRPDSIQQTLETYRTWLAQAQPLYQKTLWNGRYYKLDSGSGSDVVMTDQLCGQFYARLLDLPDVVPEDCARTALQTIYDTCFVKFNQWVQIHSNQSRIDLSNPISLGAANGVRPDGSPEDPNATHPLEVWTGINFGLAAFLAQMGMEREAMTIAQAIIQQVYQHGLQFRTPEAITADRTFRACHYLRPMAIWGLYGVLTGWQPVFSLGVDERPV